jgi:transposase InsO family protein
MRFGHLGYSGLRDLVKKQLVQGMSNLDFENKFCEGCVIEKQTRRKFRKSKFSTTRPLENEYFITFINDYLRKCWVYFLEKKPEAFHTFKEFKVMVEKTTGKNIWSLRSDRGDEYLSNEFKSYCENHKIRRYFTAPYKPQQNGLIKRKNRTILDMVRSIIKTKKMPKEFWAEVVQCAVYI